MFEILSKQLIAPQVWRFSLHAPDIAAKRQAGHFVIVRPLADSERIPLTIVSSDAGAGSIDIIFQTVGATTADLADLPVGASVHDVAGPLGHPTHIEKYNGTTVMVGGGVGIAPLLPIAQAFHALGNRVVTVLGGRTQELLILESDLKPISAELLVATDDGSRGKKGLVTDVLRELMGREKIELVVAIGPVVMMKAVAELTRPVKIKTMVSLNPLMLDGTGMCGVCRCTVDGKTKFACVDGPEFDAHQVDFDSIRRRLAMFKAEERASLENRTKGKNQNTV